MSARGPNTGFVIVWLVLLIVPIPIARLNLRAGRGDVTGALRLAAFYFSASMLAWIFGGTHVADASEVKELIVACSITMYFSMLQATVYVALEPYVRRRWPHVLMGWSRLLAGQISDPLATGEILAGTTVGVLLTLHIAVLLRLAWPLPDTEVAPAALLGLRHLVAELLLIAPDAVNKGLALAFLVFLMRVLLRNGWVAGAALAAMLTVLSSTGSNAIVWEINGVLFAGMILLMQRIGLLSVIAALFTTYALRLFPATTDALGLVRTEWSLRTPGRPGPNRVQFSMRNGGAATNRSAPVVRLKAIYSESGHHQGLHNSMAHYHVARPAPLSSFSGRRRGNGGKGESP